MKEIELTTYKPKIFDDPEFCVKRDEDWSWIRCKFLDVDHDLCMLFTDWWEHDPTDDDRMIYKKCEECKQHYKASKK